MHADIGTASVFESLLSKITSAVSIHFVFGEKIRIKKLKVDGPFLNVNLGDREGDFGLGGNERASRTRKGNVPRRSRSIALQMFGLFNSLGISIELYTEQSTKINRQLFALFVSRTYTN